MTFSTKIKLYAELTRADKPIGLLLLLWPTLLAILIATHGHPSITILFIFITGTFLARSAGCIINDIADRRIDPHVTRTKNRVLASKRVMVPEAFLLLSVLLLIGLILLLFLNHLTILLACIAMLFTGFYPLFKRWTHFPQVMLGITFNFGILMAFTATQDQLPFVAFLLYLSGVCSTIAYDTFYGMVDQEDDKKIGVKSTAIFFGKYLHTIVLILELACFILLVIIGFYQHLNIWYDAGLLLAFFCLIYQQIIIQTKKRWAYFSAFTSHHWFWFFVCLGCYINYIYR